LSHRTGRLGDLCTITKGKSPTTKTPPGPYPLVTTAEERKSADSYQFDSEAVCVPLVSSTGHGHASLKRVHYQSGKFALANILAAVQVKVDSILSTRFLARYLMHFKDQLIVPLMTGTANMSLSVDRLAKLEVSFPPLVEQERIVRLLDEADAIRKLRARADQRTADLIPALFHKMFGDPVANPMGWPRERLGDLVTLTSGGTPSRKNPSFWNGDVPWVSPKDMKLQEITGSEEQVSDTAVHSTSLRLAPANTVLIVVRGMILARTVPIGVARVPVTINQDMKALLPKRELDSTYLCSALLAQQSWIEGHVSTAGHGTKRLPSDALENLEIPLAPVEVQLEFAQHVRNLNGLRGQQSKSRCNIDSAIVSLLHSSFETDDGKH